MLNHVSKIAAVIVSLLAGCAHAPETRRQAAALESQADGTVASMTSQDPSLRPMLTRAAGYVVFPEVTEGGLVVGGRGGVGVVYAHDRQIGYAEMRAGTVGAQVGGQSYGQIVVFQTEAALSRFRAGNFDLSANVTATALQSGAAANARFENGVAVFVDDESGLMAGASVAGENMSFSRNRPGQH
jgi:lipid-binding SYLF domain-containing protein